jgi:hypothetical protein
MRYLSGPPIEYRRTSSSPRGGLLLLAAALLLVLASYVGPRFRTVFAVKAEPKKPAAPLSITSVEDLHHHVEAAEDALAGAVRDIRQMEDNTRRVLPGLQREHMDLDRGRVQAANAASGNAHQAIEKALQELEITKNLLLERTSPQ